MMNEIDQIIHDLKNGIDNLILENAMNAFKEHKYDIGDWVM